MSQQRKYVPESADLEASRALEAASGQTFSEELSDALDLSKDWLNPLTGERFGVPEAYSHKYDAPRPA